MIMMFDSILILICDKYRKSNFAILNHQSICRNYLSCIFGEGNCTALGLTLSKTMKTTTDCFSIILVSTLFYVTQKSKTQLKPTLR